MGNRAEIYFISSSFNVYLATVVVNVAISVYFIRYCMSMNSFVRPVDFCGLFVFIAEWSKWYVAYNLQVGLTVTVPIVV